jgi:cytochrome o ubiquinol oxidase subunit 2
VLWGVPCAIIAVLATITWITTHDLDPYRPLKSDVKPIDINVVALDWKWLFIYPSQGIATVNEVAFPANTPVNFHITSDTVMNSFFIPALGSQIYAMAGMETQDHLIADHTGSFFGLSAQFSGRGFSDMHFRALAETPGDFSAWVQKVKSASDHLDPATYQKVMVPSEKVPVQYFSNVEPDLFGEIIAKYQGKAGAMQASMKE